MLREVVYRGSQGMGEQVLYFFLFTWHCEWPERFVSTRRLWSLKYRKGKKEQAWVQDPGDCQSPALDTAQAILIGVAAK